MPSHDRWRPEVSIPVVLGLSVLGWVGIIIITRAIVRLF
jgi:hypothetical protein